MLKKVGGFAIQPDSVAVGHYVGVLAPANAALRDRIDELLRAAMRDGSLERILRKWNIWNDDQPALHRQVLAGETIPPTVGLDTAPSVATMSGVEAARRYLPSLLQASIDHHRAVVSVDGAGGRRRRADRHRTRLRLAGGPPRADRLRRADARHADSPAAVRPLLRHRRGDSAAGVCRRAARAGAELRGLRERDLSLGARGDLHRSARGGADARA